MMSKRLIVLAAAAAALLAAPVVVASTVSVYGTNWDTSQADDTFGGGVTAAFGQRLAGEVRAAYYEELTNEPLEDIFDGDSPFATGLRAIPLELGLRLDLNPSAGAFHPHLSAGGSYFALDSDFGNVDDELGYYAGAGARIGNGEGADFVAEVTHRWAEATVTDLGDLDGDGIDDDVAIDLNGFGVNVGVSWRW